MASVRQLAGMAGLGALAAATVGLYLAPARSAPPEPARPTRVLWVGDSYTAGVGSTNGKGYPATVCARLRWECVVDGQGGTGFVADGSNNSPAFVPFIERLDEDAARITPDVVIVDGGRNDEREPPAKVVAAATEYVGALRSTYPQARIIFVVPSFLNPQNANEARIGKLLSQLAVQQQGDVIDPQKLGWIRTDQQGKALLGKDKVHPNDAGHAFIADRLVEALTGLGLTAT